MAPKVASSLIFAHVRATTEGTLQDSNCHPFSHGSLMWMHNGGIGLWHQVKRSLALSIGEKWFLGVHGGTDSEWAFALFLDTLEKEAGVDPSRDPGPDGFCHRVLQRTMLSTIAKINALVDAVPNLDSAFTPVERRSLLNFAVTDGTSVVCTRYVSSPVDEAASLYFSSGTSWAEATPGKFKMERADKGADIVLVASEPLTYDADNWVAVPTNSIVTVHRQSVLIQAIRDENWNEEERVGWTQADKGLVSDATAGQGGVSEAGTGVVVEGKAEVKGERKKPFAEEKGEEAVNGVKDHHGVDANWRVSSLRNGNGNGNGNGSARSPDPSLRSLVNGRRGGISK